MREYPIIIYPKCKEYGLRHPVGSSNHVYETRIVKKSSPGFSGPAELMRTPDIDIDDTFKDKK